MRHQLVVVGDSEASDDRHGGHVVDKGASFTT